MKKEEKEKLEELLNQYQIENNLPELKIESLYSSFTPKIVISDSDKISEILGIPREQYNKYVKEIKNYFKDLIEKSNKKNNLIYNDKNIFPLLKKMNFKHGNELFLFSRIYQATLMDITETGSQNNKNEIIYLEEISRVKMLKLLTEFTLSSFSKEIDPIELMKTNKNLYLEKISHFLQKKNLSTMETVLFTNIVTSPEKK